MLIYQKHLRSVAIKIGRRRICFAQCFSIVSENAQKGHRPLTKEQKQRTFIAFKPDCLQRNLCGEIMSRFERKGFKLCGIKLTRPTRELAQKHYAEHSDKPFFERACRFICSGPVVATVWEGLDVVQITRKMIGSTNPVESGVGTIRGDYASHFRRNLVHGSDSVDSAEREIALWFEESEVSPHFFHFFFQKRHRLSYKISQN